MTPMFRNVPCPMRMRAFAGHREPHVRLEQRSLADLEPPLAERLQDVPVERPARERAAAGQLPMDSQPVPRERVALVPAPLLPPEPGILASPQLSRDDDPPDPLRPRLRLLPGVRGGGAALGPRAPAAAGCTEEHGGERLLAGMPEAEQMASWHLVHPGGRNGAENATDACHRGGDGAVRSGGAAFSPLFRLLPGGAPSARLTDRFPGARSAPTAGSPTTAAPSAGSLPAAVKRWADRVISESERDSR